MQLRLHHTHIFSSNIDATLKFWREMFGAQVVLDMEMAGVRNVMIAIGSGRINIYDQPPKEGRSGAFHHLGIQTDDLEGLVTDMKARGFQFRSEIREHGFLRYVMAMAPDDILLELFEIDLEKASPENRAELRRAFGF
jgi:catechol 2,3-dioxygenase-like lactoylglutathione lyase family enzyme